MFTIQSAVTVVTAGLASKLFGITENIVVWSLLITLFCSILLIVGRYKLLDKFIKIIMISRDKQYSVVSFAFFKNDTTLPLNQIFPNESGLLFLIAFLGWMPALRYFDLAFNMDT